MEAESAPAVVPLTSELESWGNSRAFLWPRRWEIRTRSQQTTNSGPANSHRFPMSLMVSVFVSRPHWLASKTHRLTLWLEFQYYFSKIALQVDNMGLTSTSSRPRSHPWGRGHILEAEVTSSRPRSHPGGRGHILEAEVTSSRPRSHPRGRGHILEAEVTSSRPRSHPRGRGHIQRCL